MRTNFALPWDSNMLRKSRPRANIMPLGTSRTSFTFAAGRPS